MSSTQVQTLESFELFNTGKIILITAPVSWRYGINSLTQLALSLTNEYAEDGESWFVFVHKSRRMARVLHYEQNSVTLFEKRFLNDDRFEVRLKSLESNEPNSAALTRLELKILFSGGFGNLLSSKSIDDLGDVAS